MEMSKVLTAFVSRLAQPARKTISPGALYRLLSSELRRQQPRRCGCSMPLFFLKDRGAEANWDLETLWPQCPECRVRARQIAAQYARHYDIHVPREPQRARAKHAQRPVMDQQDAALA